MKLPGSDLDWEPVGLTGASSPADVAAFVEEAVQRSVDFVDEQLEEILDEMHLDPSPTERAQFLARVADLIRPRQREEAEKMVRALRH